MATNEEPRVMVGPSNLNEFVRLMQLAKRPFCVYIVACCGRLSPQRVEKPPI